MSFLGKVFSSNKAIESAAASVGKVINGTVDGVDKIVFTEEEKAEARQKFLIWFLEYTKESSGQDLSRRIIAWIIVSIWSINVITIVLLFLFGYMEKAEQLMKVMDNLINPPFEIIMGFYFLAHAIRTFFNNKQKI